MNKTTTTLLLTLLLAAPAARAQDAPPPAGPAPLDHPGLHAGDAKAAMEALLKALEAAPTDPQVPLVITELRQVWELVPGGPKTCADRLQAVLQKMGPHHLQDDVLAALAELSRMQGDIDAVKRIQTARGFVREFLVTGAFGVAPSASLDEAFEPELAAAEREFDARARFTALRGDAGWIPVTVETPDTTVQVGRAATAPGAVTYALAHVEVPSAVDGWLVYTGPSARIWLNRALATVIDRSRERLDQELRIPVRFAAGWNRILVKLGDGRGARFTLRLADERGAPLAAKSSMAPRSVAFADARPTPPRSSDALTRLATRTAAGRQALYAHALAITGRGEEAYTVLEDLRRSAPELERAAWFWLLAGDLAQRADHLPGAARRDQARGAYERALALDPKSVRARRRLAEFAFQDDKTRDGIVLLEKIVADHPHDTATRLRLVEVLMRKRWLLDAERALEEAAAAAPDLPPVLEVRAQLLEQRDQAREAHAVRERLLTVDRSEAWVLLRRLDRAIAEGDRARADAAIDELVTLGWGRFEALERRASVARAFGDREGELAARRARVAERPWDLDLHVALASCLAEDAWSSPSARAEAVSVLEAVLQAEPGRHQARRLHRALQGQGDGEDRFWEEWAPDVEKVLAEAPPASHWPRAATACLFDQTVTRIYPDGSSVDVVHQLFQILNEGGKERYGSRPKGGELLVVRTITPSGEVLEPIQAGNTFEMPGLAPGAVVEHAYKVERDRSVFQYTNGPFYFQDPDLTEPFWLSRWVIWVHRDAPVVLVQKNMDRPGITHQVEERGEWRVHVFTAKDRPRFEVEPAAPDRDELLPWVKVVERRALEEIGAFYRESARQGAVVTTQIARRAAALTAELDDDAEKARALYRFVQEHVTRPSDGGSGTAAQVLSSRAGSKTTLLLALLEAARVPFKLVVAGPSPLQAEPIDWTLPEPGHFRTRLLRVEPRGGQAHYVYAEAAKLAPYGRLPTELWGAPAYVCEQGGGVLEVLPYGDFEAEGQRGEVEIALQPGGKARVSSTRELPGLGMFRLKEAFAQASAVQLRSFFAQQANGLFAGARLVDSGALRLDEVGAPLAYRFVADVPEAVRARGDGALTLSTGLTPTRLKESLGAHRRREFDLIVREPLVIRDTARIDLGPYACPRLPSDVTLQTRIGQFSLLHVREGDGRLRIERLLILRPGRVTPEEYASFREFLSRMDEAERRTLPLEEKK